MTTLKVEVTDIQQVTKFVKQFTLTPLSGESLPCFSGGSHIIVSMNINGRIHRNAYSLMGPTNLVDNYQIAVRKQEHSRGGSVFMHEVVSIGTELEITPPMNLFSINKMARKHLLLAGGIGITPFMSQIFDLNRLGYNYELHYAYRSSENAAFREQLEQVCGDKVKFYVSSDDQRLELHRLLSQQPLGTHVYVCGPDSMVKSVLITAKNLGWPDNHVHSEQFSAPPMGEEFTVKLVDSDIKVTVPNDMSLLEAIENAGIDAPYSCRGGACGRCEIKVIECDGLLEHNDHYLSETEKQAGNKIMTCVSRAKCNELAIKL